MKQITTIIFDMDGVIVDSEPIHMKIEQELFHELGLEITTEEHWQYVGTSAHEMWEDIIDKYQLPVSADKILAEKQQRYLKHLSNTEKLNHISGIKRLIRHFYKHNKSLVLASSATREEIKFVLNKLNLKTYFPITISGAELERSKPDPMIFLKASTLSQTPPEQCCVIEDSENGVRAAKAAGMRCIGYRNPHSGDQDLSKADVILDDFGKQNWEKILS
ncbi:haloacid dehalogenase superfamily, subfamily IA, variant 3 with third motif having DD or ED/haloacid dehalogenase superfamily, subfamily IA, variant 1 with third motif having Dx(3-4)D or Dx(3-4)E [Fodinibius roseus]|uniref:Haloacid dehalogenase superfamily, subfamily IA, variant 3 with third motif having DD or ED/haloacid dehalogenase superfamily, subfamily IA, variant 1 with third motif having Dx(3-4)D or Dx(3-4)E n=1 Tax=Fodinibius roseus TaxID=1194090 RepID=A0A1M4Z064_9BACT|nr:HAD family phosphatase [Fodinibius roseus]SHF11217.1 haloacid dehalogenase superfamily, subfamily IA, variant 3 with third motif having DD or ED/haloacid dehalogenase superfamily, subfamily IA, variant 1 with third motif having Dx(3-4)D or Dx(3-4)E [Fodinibius roseus]